MFEIIDNKGTLYSGSEEEMRVQFQLMSEDENSEYEWEGDLRLIEVIGCIR